MNFDRKNTSYRSIPVNDLSTKTERQTSTSATTKIDNTEEFAKLDALLADLLSEVEQPILLNQEGVITNWQASKNATRVLNNGSGTANVIATNERNDVDHKKILKNLDDVERSIDYLNEQKEKLRLHKTYHRQNKSVTGSTGDDIILEEEDQYISSSNEPQSSYRKIKSKVDYYVSNSNEPTSSPGFKVNSMSNRSIGTNTGTTITPNNGYSSITTSTLNKQSSNIPINTGYRTLSTTASVGVGSDAFIENDENLLNQKQHRLVNAQTQTQAYNNQTIPVIINNKPPLSPNSRVPSFSQHHHQQQQQQQQQHHLQTQNNNQPSTFRTISMSTMKHINETDDDGINDPDFDRLSVRSGYSTVSAVQRSKYHVVSNNYVEHTKPQSIPNRYMQNKRAFSAPPTEIGKIVLQRIELKSPLTVRTITQPQTAIPIDIQSQIDSNEQTRKYNEQYLTNPYNNRSILRTNSLQPQPQRVNYSRALSERPRNLSTTTGGYDTDTGVVNYNYRTIPNSAYKQQIQQQNRMDFVDSDADSMKVSSSYRNGPTNYQRSTVSCGRFNTGGTELNGYDTDTGLINARNNFYQRALEFRNTLNNKTNVKPIKVDHYQNKTTTKLSFPDTQSQSQQQQQSFITNETRTTNINSNNNRAYNMNTINHNDMMTIDETNRLQQQQQQYNTAIDANKSAFHSIKIQNKDRVPTGQVDASSGSIIKTFIQETTNGNSNNLGQNQTIIETNMNSNTNKSLVIPVTVVDNNNANLEITNNLDSRRSSASDINDIPDVSAKSTQKSVKNTQNFWYKPKISREDAINILKDKPPGTFLIRDSNNFPGAYGLALKVDKLPPNVPIKQNSTDQSAEYVRHFLIEPTAKGVRIKGCCNEPVFASLAALVYQHSITPMALPCKLILPTKDLTELNTIQKENATSLQTKPQSQPESLQGRQLLEKGAACNVYYLNSVNVESLNGTKAIAKAITNTSSFDKKDASQLILVQFKVNAQGLFVTDLNRKKFTRNHYPTNTILFSGIDDTRVWPTRTEKIQYPRIFGVVCKPRVTTGHNECHLFVELDPDQPAIAIVDFINRYLIPSKTI